eukprot:TRINITY_DN3323_c1_g3_i3.p1 TRINITY_DN3323_c1_g3~~TRINITY_DN3323_c1_g3_i3.p1  ORF type:complete len:246 (-),score=31.37 TRINITY_DN3323_c1_g3_i3:1257-1964(-)
MASDSEMHESKNFLSSLLQNIVIIVILGYISSIVIYMIKYETDGLYLPYLAEAALVGKQPANGIFTISSIVAATTFLILYLILTHVKILPKVFLWMGFLICSCLMLIAAFPVENYPNIGAFYRIVSLITFLGAGVQAWSLYIYTKNKVSKRISKLRLILSLMWTVDLILLYANAFLFLETLNKYVSYNTSHSIGAIFQYLLIFAIVGINWSLKYELNDVIIFTRKTEIYEEEECD